MGTAKAPRVDMNRNYSAAIFVIKALAATQTVRRTASCGMEETLRFELLCETLDPDRGTGR